MEAFELTDTTGDEYEFIITPQAPERGDNEQPQETLEESDIFEDALSDNGNDPIEAEPQTDEASGVQSEPTPLRRSTRTTAGVPPQRYGDWNYGT